MTNAEKYKSPDERRIAYEDYCKVCEKEDKALMDEFLWLDLEYEELKPCPFCGGEANIVVRSGGGVDFYFAECKACYAKAISFYKKDNAISAWNRRV